MVRAFCLIAFFISINVSFANERLHVAVTASFKPVIEALSQPFFEKTQIQLVISSASTGVLYQQIVRGAPFDVFLAADAQRPALLIETLSLSEQALFTYALGKLVLISHTPLVQSVIDLSDFDKKIIIANPLLAPFGTAANQVLQSVGNESTLIQANNVAQARQYLSLKLANVGLISASLSAGFDSVVEVPTSMYDVIVQQGVILKSNKQSALFLDFLNKPESQQLIQQMGYQLPVN